MRTTAGAVLDGGGKVFKDAKHVIGIHVCEAKGTNAGGIDNPAGRVCIIGGEGKRYRLGRGMPAFAYARYFPRLPIRCLLYTSDAADDVIDV